MQYRQGDVLLERIDNLPKGLKPKDKVLAYGEATGHKHHFVAESVSVFVDKKGMQYARLNADAELLHEEHHQITIPKGVYRVGVQREFDLVSGVKQVMD